jgi:hypothetical protein
MDSMASLSLVSTSDVGLLLASWNVWSSRFCASSFFGLQLLIQVLEYIPPNVQGCLNYWNLSLRLSHSLERYKETWVVT